LFLFVIPEGNLLFVFAVAFASKSFAVAFASKIGPGFSPDIHGHHQIGL
jgi:hypothetical protein